MKVRDQGSSFAFSEGTNLEVNWKTGDPAPYLILPIFFSGILAGRNKSVLNRIYSRCNNAVIAGYRTYLQVELSKGLWMTPHRSIHNLFEWHACQTCQCGRNPADIMARLPEYIQDDQKWFLLGKFIGENTRLTFDIIAECEWLNKDGIIMIIDFEKAFDMVSCEFIFKMLKNFQFLGKSLRLGLMFTIWFIFKSELVWASFR